MIKRIVDGIYQLKVPIPYDFGEVNCYFIRGENGFTVVDTGAYTNETKEIWEKVLSRFTIEKLVVTHSHPDHIGLASWLQKRFGIPVWLSKKGYKEVVHIRSLFVGERYSGSLSDIVCLNGGSFISQEGENHYFKYETYNFEPEVVFEENKEITLGSNLYKAIWTPGHSPDHICYYNKGNGILLVGDHILSSINPIVLAEKLDENPLSDYLTTFDKLLGCKVKYVLTAHGDQIANLKERIESLRMHYRKRWQQILKAIQDDKATAFEITKRVYGNKISVERLAAAFIQTITNLIYLESEGFVEKEKLNGILYYYAVGE